LAVNGSPEDKFQLMFTLWDLDGTGKITQDEMEQVFKHCYKSLFTMLLAKQGQTNEGMNLDLTKMLGEQLSEQLASQLMGAYDKDKNGYLDREEFFLVAKDIHKNGGMKFNVNIGSEKFSGPIGFF
jgi:Ca2+-binding EF-hand superfamily protein